MTFKHIESDEDFCAIITECDRLLTIKGHDYTQGQSDNPDNHHGRLKNFYRNAERLGLSGRQVLAVYMNKHLDAIETFLKGDYAGSEPIEGRICDAINYLLLLGKMVRVEERDEVADAARAIAHPRESRQPWHAIGCRHGFIPETCDTCKEHV